MKNKVMITYSLFIILPFINSCKKDIQLEFIYGKWYNCELYSSCGYTYYTEDFHWAFYVPNPDECKTDSLRSKIYTFKIINNYLYRGYQGLNNTDTIIKFKINKLDNSNLYLQQVNPNNTLQKELTYHKVKCP